MVESSTWSDPQSAVTTELGEARDVAAHAPRRRCELPKVRPRQLNASDQRVPVYWDQTVPVWSCKEATSISSSSKRKADSGCELSSRRFGDGGGDGGCGATNMFLDNTLESCCCCCCCCCEDGRPAHSALVDGARGGAVSRSEEVEVAVNSPAASRGSSPHVAQRKQTYRCEACKQLSRGPTTGLGAVAIRIGG